MSRKSSSEMFRLSSIFSSIPESEVHRMLVLKVDAIFKRAQEILDMRKSKRCDFTAEYVHKLSQRDGYLLMTGADIKQIDESGSWYPLEDRLILISGTFSHSARTTSILHTLDGIKKLKLDYYHTRDINSRIMEPGNRIRVWGSVNPFEDLEIVTCVRTERIN